MKFYQQIRSVKRSKLAELWDDIISVDGFMRSQIIRHDLISVKNVVITLKLCRLFDLGVGNICTNFCEFSYSTLSGETLSGEAIRREKFSSPTDKILHFPSTKNSTQ